MMDITKMIIDANMNTIYALSPEGELLLKARELEKKLIAYAAANPGAMDIVGEAGLRDEYNKLYMDIMTGETGSISAEDVMGRMNDIQSQYDDNAVQKQIKADLSAILEAFVFGWTDAQTKIREGHIYMDKYAQGMVVIRKLARRYYAFLSEDMGINITGDANGWFEIMSVAGLENIDSAKASVFKEIMSSKSIEEILCCMSG